jgi:hypothetical protein
MSARVCLLLPLKDVCIFLVQSLCLMIFDVSGDLLADGRKIKQLIFDKRIVGPFGNFAIDSCVYAKTIRPILRGKVGIVEIGVVTIHSRAFNRTPNA